MCTGTRAVEQVPAPIDERVRMDDLLSIHGDGVFLRREALANGYDDDDLARGLRSGQLARVRHGAYTDRSVWNEAGDVERHRLRGHAVLRSHASPLALSHTSAAVEHGLTLFRPDLDRIHVTCLDKPLARTTRDVVYHCPSSVQGLTFLPDGIVVVDPARAAVEAAALATVQAGVVVLDSALHLQLARPEDLAARYSERARWPHSRHLQITMRLARVGAESAGESLMRFLMWQAGLPQPVLQYEVRDARGRIVGRTDFAWPDYGVLGEFDGMVKYTRHLRPGESPGDALRREKVREDRIRELTGWLMIRFVWDDISNSRSTVDRIREQLRRGQLAMR